MKCVTKSVGAQIGHRLLYLPFSVLTMKVLLLSSVPRPSQEIYHFRLLYSGTTFMFPILGSLRMTRQAGGRRVLCQRRESGGSEVYEPVGCWLGREPNGQVGPAGAVLHTCCVVGAKV